MWNNLIRIASWELRTVPRLGTVLGLVLNHIQLATNKDFNYRPVLQCNFVSFLMFVLISRKNHLASWGPHLFSFLHNCLCYLLLWSGCWMDHGINIISIIQGLNIYMTFFVPCETKFFSTKTFWYQVFEITKECWKKIPFLKFYFCNISLDGIEASKFVLLY